MRWNPEHRRPEPAAPHRGAHPETFFITDHYRDYPSVVVRLAAIDRALLRDVVERSWRVVAPKRPVAQYDAT